MQNLTIFFGDVGSYLATVAKKHDDSACLLDCNNYKKIIDLEPKNSTTLYTSLGDFPGDIAMVYDMLSRTNTIFYCPLKQWSDNKSLDLADPVPMQHKQYKDIILQHIS